MARRPPGMFITSSILKQRGVCPGWRKKFRQKFPKGRVYITQRLCEDRAQTWPWFNMAEKLLTPEGFELFKQNEAVIESLKYQENMWASVNPISKRARNVAKASIFGYLAQRAKYDPARQI